MTTGPISGIDSQHCREPSLLFRSYWVNPSFYSRCGLWHHLLLGLDGKIHKKNSLLAKMCNKRRYFCWVEWLSPSTYCCCSICVCVCVCLFCLCWALLVRSNPYPLPFFLSAGKTCPGKAFVSQLPLHTWPLRSVRAKGQQSVLTHTDRAILDNLRFSLKDNQGRQIWKSCSAKIKKEKKEYHCFIFAFGRRLGFI